MSDFSILSRIIEEQKDEISRLFRIAVVFSIKTKEYSLVLVSQSESFSGYELPITKQQAEAIMTRAKLKYEYHNELFETLTYSNTPF